MGCWSSGRGEAGPPGGSSQVAGWEAVHKPGGWEDWCRVVCSVEGSGVAPSAWESLRPARPCCVARGSAEPRTRLGSRQAQAPSPKRPRGRCKLST